MIFPSHRLNNRRRKSLNPLRELHSHHQRVLIVMIMSGMSFTAVPAPEACWMSMAISPLCMPHPLTFWSVPEMGVDRTGLPPVEDELYDSSSESEFEDEADEDSNGVLSNFPTELDLHVDFSAEEYYKNDYPDEEEEDYSSGTGGKCSACCNLSPNVTSRRISRRF